jgi:hypothetical protein
MLNRSGESKLKVDAVIAKTRKSCANGGDAAVYASFSEKVKHNLCCARILQGNFSQWDGWQYRDEWAAAMRYGICHLPYWNAELTDSLVIIGEQGLGDEVLWGTILPEAMVRCTRVTYCCDERLVIPLARSLPGLHTKTRYVDAKDDLLDGDYTAYITAADLLCLFRKRKGDFPRKPYLIPDETRLYEMEQYRGMVGLSWKGRHGCLNPLKFDLKNVISLQYDETHPDIPIPHIDLRNDVEGLIALCSVLEKVVSVPTSIWHIAAAVGCRTEVVIAPKGSEADGVIDRLDWHCPEGKSPWYGKSVVCRDVVDWWRTCGLR